MKYQGLSVIFVLIMLPISIVLSYYIQLQTDTLTLQTSYQTKLNDSTYDAIAAYQLNSLNTQRVRGESIKSYVTASVNTFFTTMATNLGMSSASKSMVLPYVPAILFTTYDGYYIYSPTYVSKIAINPIDGMALKDDNDRILYLKSGYTITDDDTMVDSTTGKKVPNMNKIEPKCTTDPSSAQKEINYMLKPFIYYSAQYKDNAENYDFIASYSLDNYMTVYGTKRTSSNRDTGTFVTDDFTKSGYLLNSEDTNKIKIEGSILVKLLAKRNSGASYDAVSAPDILSSKEDIKKSNEEAYSPSNTTHDTIRYMAVDAKTDDAYNYINYYLFDEGGAKNGYGKTYYANKVSGSSSLPIRTTTGDEIIADTLEIDRLIGEGSNFRSDYKDNLLFNPSAYEKIKVTYDGVEIEDDGAKEYYIKAYFFSKWVYRNLRDVPASNIQEIKDNSQNSQYYTDFTGDNNKIFDISNPNNNPESDFSWFAEHKREVIKNSIQYNLNLSISTYNYTYDFSNDDIDYGLGYTLPVLRNQDWENILNNVCMVAFMQGMPCGLTTFNSYSVVKSNNNNTFASLENMYFAKKIRRKVEKDASGSTSYIYQYHKIDCPKLGTEDTEYVDIYEGDQSAEFKYDAKKINVRIDSVGNPDIVCFYDSETNKYYEYINIYDVDEKKASKSVEDLAVGEEITDQDRIQHELSNKPLGNDVIYLYDHANEGCYDCIISGKYNPAIVTYDGELYRTWLTYEDELIINVGDGTHEKWLFANGAPYENLIEGTDIPTKPASGDRYLITETEFRRRKKSIYTELARIKNSLYKTNSYLNR